MSNRNVKWIYNNTVYDQSKVFIPILQNLTRALLALLATFKKSVSPVCGYLRSTLMKKKEEKKLLNMTIFLCSSKTQNSAKNNIFQPFLHANQTSLTCFEDANLRYWTVNFKTPKILHVVCCNLSQIDVTKMLRPFQAMINFKLCC